MTNMKNRSGDGTIYKGKTMEKVDSTRIREIRKNTGLTQAQFAAALNIPVRTLEKWETGERVCPVYVVELIEYRVRTDTAFPKKK